MSDNNRREQVLAAMGLDQWVPKEQLRVVEQSPEVELEVETKPNLEAKSEITPTTEAGQTSYQASKAAEPARVREQAGTKPEFSYDGPPVLSTAKDQTSAPPVVLKAVPIDVEKVKSLDWQTLQQTATDCTGCDLYQERTQTVFGVGDQQADWLIIGEAPGQQEDIEGEPFVGRTGLLLNNMLIAAGQPREKVYISNVVKCRTPGNRDPKEDETGTCQSYLRRQVELLKPKLILVVGRVAAQSLLETTTPVGKLRGKVYQFPGTTIPMVVTYDPAYLLRRPAEKSKSWQDLKLAMSTFNER